MTVETSAPEAESTTKSSKVSVNYNLPLGAVHMIRQGARAQGIGVAELVEEAIALYMLVTFGEDIPAGMTAAFAKQFEDIQAQDGPLVSA